MIFLEYREAMSKPSESAGPEEIPNDMESLSEPSCSVAHLSALEHCTDVCEWAVSGLNSWFILGKKHSFRDCYAALVYMKEEELTSGVLYCRKML